ncbi:MAG: Eco57I restriction-modification methylase domain-containing protein [Burkholderiales bacterium]
MVSTASGCRAFWHNDRQMTGQLQQEVIVPISRSDECPLAYAERLGAWYSAQTTESHRRRFGVYFTPSSIARYMAGLCRNGGGHFVRVLDPAAGTGVLACAACVSIANAANPPRHIELVCHEVDNAVQAPLEAALVHLQRWLAARRIRLRYRIELEDFLLANGAALEAGLLQSVEPKFDAVICNPPYFKLAKSDRRAWLCASVVHGQPNIYGLFMAVAAAVLREGGRLAFITPRSYAAGPYFQRFREVFFRLIRPTDIHVFESRTEAFSDVLQETVITAGTRLRDWDKRRAQQRIRLTTSTGADDVGSSATRTLPLSSVLRGDCNHRVLYFPASKQHDRAAAVIRKWPGSLHTYGWEVSTGPVVAFRAKRFLRDAESGNTVPLLWLQNVKAMETRWPVDTRKSQHLLACAESQPIILPNRNYVVLRRFSAKEDRRRLTAAPHIARSVAASKIGLENHLNFIHKPAGQLSGDEVYGLAALLNSKLLDTYFRMSSGNTQVSATELRAMRLPGLDAIRKIGARVRDDPAAFEQIVGEEVAYGG